MMDGTFVWFLWDRHAMGFWEPGSRVSRVGAKGQNPQTKCPAMRFSAEARWWHPFAVQGGVTFILSHLKIGHLSRDMMDVQAPSTCPRRL